MFEVVSSCLTWVHKLDSLKAAIFHINHLHHMDFSVNYNLVLDFQVIISYCLVAADWSKPLLHTSTPHTNVEYSKNSNIAATFCSTDNSQAFLSLTYINAWWISVHGLHPGASHASNTRPCWTEKYSYIEWITRFDGSIHLMVLCEMALPLISYTGALITIGRKTIYLDISGV